MSVRIFCITVKEDWVDMCLIVVKIMSQPKAFCMTHPAENTSKKSFNKLHSLYKTSHSLNCGAFECICYRITCFVTFTG